MAEQTGNPNASPVPLVPSGYHPWVTEKITHGPVVVQQVLGCLTVALDDPFRHQSPSVTDVSGYY